VAINIELRIMDRNDLAVRIDHVRLAAAEKAKHVSLYVDLLAHSVILIDDEAQLITSALDRISRQRERVWPYAEHADAPVSKWFEVGVESVNLLWARRRVILTKEEDDGLLASNAKFLESLRAGFDLKRDSILGLMKMANGVFFSSFSRTHLSRKLCALWKAHAHDGPWCCRCGVTLSMRGGDADAEGRCRLDHERDAQQPSQHYYRQIAVRMSGLQELSPRTHLSLLSRALQKRGSALCNGHNGHETRQLPHR
jgi:hypothetical protein